MNDFVVDVRVAPKLICNLRHHSRRGAQATSLAASIRVVDGSEGPSTLVLRTSRGIYAPLPFRPAVYGGNDENSGHCILSLVYEVIGELKGFSSFETNRRLGSGRKLLHWQTGYGIVSFGTGDMEWVREYVRNQKEHHAAGRVFERLEAITEDEG